MSSSPRLRGSNSAAALLSIHDQKMPPSTASAMSLDGVSLVPFGDQKSDNPFEAVLNEGFGLHHVGGRYTSAQPLFSARGDVLVCVSGQDMILFSTETSMRVGVLSGHDVQIVAIALSSRDSSQLYSVSSDGVVIVWDLNTRKSINKWELNRTVTHMVYSGVNGRDLFMQVTSSSTATGASTQTDENKAAPYEFGYFSVSTGEFHKCCAVPRSFATICASHSGETVAFVISKSLYIWDVVQNKVFVQKHSHRMTCIDFHPTDPFLATGDSAGHITLWYKYKSKRPVTADLHWHSSNVNAVSFTEDGAYLLSGGQEAVLVIWQVETGHKQFLPRLGGCIEHFCVSANGKWFGATCSHNAILLIDAIASKVQRSIVGLQSCSTAAVTHDSAHTSANYPSAAHSVFAVQPRSNHLVVRADKPGSVQVYDMFKQRQVREITISRSNVVARSSVTVTAPSSVDRICFSSCATWMVTSERRKGRDVSPLTQLKFWKHNVDTNRYELNTRMYNPHRGPVSTLVFHPTENVLVTASSGDNTFRIWAETHHQRDVSATAIKRKLSTSKKHQYDAEDDLIGPSVSFQCRSVGYYRKGMRLRDASFSVDGSILAVCYDETVTLWDPLTLVLKGQLTHNNPRQNVERVTFVPGSPFIVTATSDRMYVWNLLTMSIWWSLNLSVAGIVAGTVPLLNTDDSDVPLDASQTCFAVAVSSLDPELVRSLFAMKVYHGADTVESVKHDITESDAKNTASATAKLPHILLFSTESPQPIKGWCVPNLYMDRQRGRIGTRIAAVPRPHSRRAGEMASIVYSTRSGQVVLAAGLGSLLQLSTDADTAQSAIVADMATSKPSAWVDITNGDAGRSVSHAAAAVQSIVAGAASRSGSDRRPQGRTNTTVLGTLRNSNSGANVNSRSNDDSNALAVAVHAAPSIDTLYTSFVDSVAEKKIAKVNAADPIQHDAGGPGADSDSDSDGDGNDAQANGDAVMTDASSSKSQKKSKKMNGNVAWDSAAVSNMVGDLDFGMNGTTSKTSRKKVKAKKLNKNAKAKTKAKNASSTKSRTPSVAKRSQTKRKGAATERPTKTRTRRKVSQ
jgi:WD40 repeat protein